MSVAEQEQIVEPTIGGAHEANLAILEDAEAWHAYGMAVRRGAPADVRRSLFDRALRSLRHVADALGERPWPVRSSDWRRS